MHVIVVGCGRVGSELAGTWRATATPSPSSTRRPAPSAACPRTSAGATVVGFGFDRDHLHRGRHRAGRGAGRGHQRRQLQHRHGPGRPGDLRHRAGRGPHLRPPAGRDLPAPRHPHRGHRAWTTDQVLRRLLPDEARPSGSTPAARSALVERGLPGAVGGQASWPASNEPGRFWLTRRHAGWARPGSPTADLVGQEGDVAAPVTVRRPMRLDAARATGSQAGKDH